MNIQRVRLLKQGREYPGAVVYWMSRDQRALDNWALIYAQSLASERRQPLEVVFCLAPSFLNAPLRHYYFMLNGLKETAQALAQKQIAFTLVQGEPRTEIPRFLTERKAGVLVADFDPLRIKRQWKKQVASRITVPFYEVDAHNVVPCWLASPKQEFAAYTFRPKIHRLLPAFLEDYPRLKKHPFARRGYNFAEFSATRVLARLRCDKAVTAVTGREPGTKAGLRQLRRFIGDGLSRYDQERNDPLKNATSQLSAYLHFGQLSAQRVAREVEKSGVSRKQKAAFLEELIVRRELADNYCWYNSNYDNFDGFPEWARKSLHAHRKDHREYLYSRSQWEFARTHDPLWNAAQMQMVLTGKMHGYMRMYWCKKILEWSRSPEEAQSVALYLNDRYELDGRDPNGYVGVAWSIGGVHDRAWGQRPVFGKIRYMSYDGCKHKFDLASYVARYEKKN